MGFTPRGHYPYRPTRVELGARTAADPAGRKAVDRRRFLSLVQDPIRARSIRPAHPMEVEAEVRNRASSAYPNPVVAE